MVIAVVPPHCFGYCYTTIRYGKICVVGGGTLRARVPPEASIGSSVSSKDSEEGKLNCTTPERLLEEDLIQLTNDRTIKRKLRGSKAISSHYSSNAASFAAAAAAL